MDDNKFWLRLWQSLFIGLVLLASAFLLFNVLQMRTLTQAGYCERLYGSGWIRCDMMKDVILR